MPSQFQQVIYEGYLARDPEMRFMPNAKPVTNFSMGSSRVYKSPSGEKVKETTWLKVAVFGSAAEIVNQYCHKGSHVIVTGILRPDKTGSPAVYQTKDGESKASYEITARDVRILDKKPEDAEAEEEDSVLDTSVLPF